MTMQRSYECGKTVFSCNRLHVGNLQWHYTMERDVIADFINKPGKITKMIVCNNSITIKKIKMITCETYIN